MNYLELLSSFPHPELPKGKRARRAVMVGVSPAASAALEFFKLTLQADETWLETTSSSVVVELLVWLALGGERSKFLPKTARRGRKLYYPAGLYQDHPTRRYQGWARPKHVRDRELKLEARIESAKSQLEKLAELAKKPESS